MLYDSGLEENIKMQQIAARYLDAFKISHWSIAQKSSILELFIDIDSVKSSIFNSAVK